MTKKNYYITLDGAGYNSMTKVEQHLHDYIRENYNNAVIGYSAAHDFKDDIENEMTMFLKDNPKRYKPVIVLFAVVNSDGLMFIDAGHVHVCMKPVSRLISIEAQ